MFEKMNWMDVEKHLEKDDRIVVVTGSCEQHGYLSLATDTLEPWEIAKKACEILKIPIAPPVTYGLNPFFNAYPGNVSLSVQTYASLIREVLESLIVQGFRRILVSNGHGGNSGVLTLVIDEILAKNDKVKISLFQWWLDPRVDSIAIKHGLKQSHANWSENHSFTRVSKVPDKPKEFVVLPKTASPSRIRELLGDGCTGGYYQANDAIMEEFFQAAVDAMRQELNNL